MELYAWDCMHGIVCMELYAWDCMHGIVCMGLYAWDCMHGIVYAWDCMHGIVCILGSDIHTKIVLLQKYINVLFSLFAKLTKNLFCRV
jgi:hypothetical protein